MSATDVMSAYRTLWKIEESFRVMKSTLEIRPVHHSSPKRIEGHFVVCFLAFLMERKMEFLLQGIGDKHNASPSQIQQALNSMQLAAITTSEGEKFIKSTSKPLAKEIFKKLKLDLPANISNKNDLISRLNIKPENEYFQMSLL